MKQLHTQGKHFANISKLEICCRKGNTVKYTAVKKFVTHEEGEDVYNQFIIKYSFIIFLCVKSIG